MENGVHLGTWTNWSRGPIFGRTLTTTKESGNLLIALTAVFVGFVASRFWRIACLCLHRWYSTSNPRETAYHQRQVILRNSTAPEAGLWSIMTLLWAWRKLPSKRLSEILPTCLLAIICLAAFTIAGGFSSSISTAVGDEVLIYSPNCAVIDTSNASNPTFIYSYFSEQLNNAANYAQQCYDSNTQRDSTAACNKFIRSTLPTASANNSAACPFDQKICRKPDANIRLDTGYIGNNELGLNSPDNLGFAWRYVLQCAPLVTDGYTVHVIDEQGIGHVRFYYGGDLMGPLDNQTVEQFLYEVEDIDYQYPRGGRNNLAGTNFRVSFSESVISRGQVLTGFSKLIPELTRSDGDTTVIFLSGNGVVFTQRMDDDWYRATERSTDLYTLGGFGYRPSYIPGIAASPMGCVEQWQWCDSAHPSDEAHCGPLASLFDSFYGAGPLFNITQEDFDHLPRPSSADASKTRFLWPAQSTIQSPTVLAQLIAQLGAKSLASQSQLLNVQWPLPDNQWQLDVTRWWHTILASVQASYIFTAQGSDDPEFRQFQSRPFNNQERELCNSQKIRSSQYTSFSLFGLLFTFVTGAVIILVSYILEPILSCFYRYKKYQPYAHFEWMTNGSLQLHRLAHEELGLQKWSNCTDDIPTTGPDVFLSGLNFTNPEHPILSRQADIQSPYHSEQEKVVVHHNEARLPTAINSEAVTETALEGEVPRPEWDAISSVTRESTEDDTTSINEYTQLPLESPSPLPTTPPGKDDKTSNITAIEDEGHW
ncbi:hypothetical protein F4680DRAFT_415976 [Xylaria scruposa]|nr:hypothetical protein F4680DRAFT_415976 [Xylaria scruposa]